MIVTPTPSPVSTSSLTNWPRSTTKGNFGWNTTPNGVKERRGDLYKSKNQHGLVSCLLLAVLAVLFVSLGTQLGSSGTHLDATLQRLALVEATTHQVYPTTLSLRNESVAIALPAILSNTNNNIDNNIDVPMHLGDSSADEYNRFTTSPAVWQHLTERYNIRSVVDVGCGRGFSTLWWLHHHVRAVCVEASPAAWQHSVVPPTAWIDHDYTRGPWWPSTTVDAVWAADFVSRVSLSYQTNYLATFRRAALVFITLTEEPGRHTVERHDEAWWIRRLQVQGGLVYENDLTQEIRRVASQERDARLPGPDGKKLAAREIINSMLVFYNPAVAQQPQHAHLFVEFGCRNGANQRRECGHGISTESNLDPKLYPAQLRPEMSLAWSHAIRQRLQGNVVNDDFVTSSNVTKYHSIVAPPMQLSNHAVFQIKQELARGNTSLPKIPVVVWPYFEFGKETAESIHIEENGITESRYLELSTNVLNFDPRVVWIGDTGYPYPWDIWCQKFTEFVRFAKQKRAQRGLPLQWPIYIVDFTDGSDRQRCRNVEEEVGTEFVRYSKRMLVERRGWNYQTKWVRTGRIKELFFQGMNYTHTPLIVRTDTIDALREVLTERGMKLSDPIEEMERPVDVTHLWPLETSKVGTVESNLRSAVSLYLDQLRHETNYTIFVGLAGKPVSEGRRGVEKSYMECLLRTKIIVMTQRDGWEDMYRLFEGLVSGALVMVDQMLAKPANITTMDGLVEFSSLEDLRAKIEYYLQHPNERLAIAKKGRYVSMLQHRTWHRMEEIIFGEALTRCVNNTDCLYIVHANEGRR